MIVNRVVGTCATVLLLTSCLTPSPSADGTAAAAGGSSEVRRDHGSVDSGTAARKEQPGWGDDWNGEVVHVEIVDSAFRPETIRVQEGTKVIWTNRDDTMHNVALPADLQLVGQALEQDDRFALVAGSPGDYGFVCTFHPTMRGHIQVLPRARASGEHG